LQKSGGLFDIDLKKKRIEEINKLQEKSEYWQDLDQSKKINKEKSILSEVINSFKSVLEKFDELEILIEYGEIDKDIDSIKSSIDLSNSLKKELEDLEKHTLLGEQMDSNNAIVTINAGAGGTESCDWAFMLNRMIIRWAESKKFTVKQLNYLYGENAGIKSSTLMIEGNFAFGLLKSESGIHRLVRISPFDSNKRRHTSFASMFVSPEVDDEIEIDIKESDLKIDVFRAGGAGGQSVNTTDSAVRITHLPSQLVVTCQNERSQLQNKLFAMKILKARLFDKMMEEKKQEQKEIEASKKEIGWGSQIRSYVLDPYKMVKDHRTGFVTSQTESVLNGDLDGFMKNFLKWNLNS
jgi:peptide chain release factor 2